MKSKTILGCRVKSRSRQQIQVEYQQHAMQLGHKMAQIAIFEEEIPTHKDAIMRLNKELAALPPEAPAAVPSPVTETHPEIEEATTVESTLG